MTTSVSRCSDTGIQLKEVDESNRMSFVCITLVSNVSQQEGYNPFCALCDAPLSNRFWPALILLSVMFMAMCYVSCMLVLQYVLYSNHCMLYLPFRPLAVTVNPYSGMPPISAPDALLKE